MVEPAYGASLDSDHGESGAHCQTSLCCSPSDLRSCRRPRLQLLHSTLSWLPFTEKNGSALSDTRGCEPNGSARRAVPPSSRRPDRARRRRCPSSDQSLRRSKLAAHGRARPESDAPTSAGLIEHRSHHQRSVAFKGHLSAVVDIDFIVILVDKNDHLSGRLQPPSSSALPLPRRLACHHIFRTGSLSVCPSKIASS